MKRFLVILFSILFLNLNFLNIISAEEWVFFGEDETVIGYIDLASIQKNETNLSLYKFSQKSAYKCSDIIIFSVNEVDFENYLWRMLSAETYIGETLESSSTFDNHWENIKPETTGDEERLERYSSFFQKHEERIMANPTYQSPISNEEEPPSQKNLLKIGD